jgi:hypothetical protein
MGRSGIRDEFKNSIVLALARRASYICSNPECHALTIGPSAADPEKIVFLGKAAHITAAAPGGARYNPSLRSDDRRSIENGIFLCPACAEKIDKNRGIDFPVDQLKKWKRDHEKWVGKNLNKSIHALVDLRAPFLHLRFDNDLTTFELVKDRVGQKHIKQKGDLSDRIVRVDLRLTNSGSGPASDIDLILGFDSLSLCTKKEIRTMWDMHPLDPIYTTEAYFAEIVRRNNRTANERLVAVMVDELGFGIFEGLLGSHRRPPSLSCVTVIPVKIEGAQASYRIPKLKQNMTRLLESVYVVFPSWRSIRSFTIQYRINMDEMTSDTLGTLKIKIKKKVGK